MAIVLLILIISYIETNYATNKKMQLMSVATNPGLPITYQALITTSACISKNRSFR